MRKQLPNLVTLAGFASGIAWMHGAPAWTALASILADEVDGRLARSMDADSEFGAELDYSVDVSLTIMALNNLLGSTIPAMMIVPLQAYLRSSGHRPDFGSIRMWLMFAGVLRDWNPISRRRPPKLRWAYEQNAS